MLGDDCGDEGSWGDVKCRVGDRRVFAKERYAPDLPVACLSFHLPNFFWVSVFDRDVRNSVSDFPVDCGAWKRDIEGNFMRLRGEGLEIGSDFIADIAAGGRSITPDDDGIDSSALDKVSSRVVDDDGVGDAMFPELEGGKAGTLVSWPGFIYPDMNRNPSINNAEVEQVATAARASSGLLMVGFNRRFSSHARAIRESFGGRVGPMSIEDTIAAGPTSGETWLTDPAMGGGRILGEACHFVYLCTYIMGWVPSQVYARRLANDLEVDDGASVLRRRIDGQY
jgi:hypothetical protein